jgi:YggT family protein
MSNDVRFFTTQFVDTFADLLVLAIFARVILSWFSPQGMPRGKIAQFINDVTDPFLRPLKSILPRTGILDLSPYVALLLIELLRYLIKSVL